QVIGAHFSAGQLRKLLPIYAEGAVDEDLLQEGLRNIRDKLQRDGYFDSQVEFTTTEDAPNNVRVITYSVNRGTLFNLDGVAFSGNRYFSSSLLASRLQLQAATYATHGKFSQRMVRDDADSIRGLYLSNGFLQADVKFDVIENYKGKKGGLFVRYEIAEGPQTRVSDLRIEGNEVLSDEKLLDVIGSSEGQPYSESNVSGDR